MPCGSAAGIAMRAAAIADAVPADVPESLAGRSFTVTLGEVSAGE